MFLYQDPTVTLRRRVPLKEDTVALNARLVVALASIKEFWSADKQACDAIFDPPVIDEDSSGLASLDFTECLVSGLMGDITYTPRHMEQFVEDRGFFDDSMRIAVHTKKADRNAFFRQSMPRVIEAFEAYRASFATDINAVIEHDFDQKYQLSEQGRGKDIDGRDSVYRIWPVNYFDDILCQRAFGISAEDVVRRAAPVCEDARIVNGGAYLIVTMEIVTGKEALDALHSRVMEAISGAGN